MSYTKRGRKIEETAEALKDLNMFAAVVALMENSLVSSHCFEAAGRIIDICQTEQAICLERFDLHMKRAGGGTYPKKKSKSRIAKRPHP